MEEDKTQIAVDLFNEFADQYRQKYMDIGLYAQVLDRFCQNLPGEEPAVLDIACGPGNISRYLLEQRPDLQILGIDLAPKMLDIAREQNPKARFF